MKILVLCSDYPDNFGGISLNYVHTRNVYYIKRGYDVTVLNFSANKSYEKDYIKVISLREYKENADKQSYDLCVCHAANIKFHYLFLKKEDFRFKHIVFFYHGHEVMKLNDYPVDYSYVKGNHLSRLFTPIYDWAKLKMWKSYITKNINKVELVFVSEWMRDTFLKNIKLSETVLRNKKLHIIYNCISSRFETCTWNSKSNKKYDFVTIRGNIDTSKFAIDFVNELAFHNPKSTFLVVGKGQYFEHYKKAPNIVRIEKYMNQDEIIEVLNSSKCALMPTRLDAQGVMTCEMATFGIPVITSDIPVCRYVLSDYSNVRYIENEKPDVDLMEILSRIPQINTKNNRFFVSETVQKELDLYENLCLES